MKQTTALIAHAMLIGLLAAPIAAKAQTIDGGAYFSPITDNVQPLIHGSLFSKSWLERRGRGSTSTGRPPASRTDRPVSDSVASTSDDPAKRVVDHDPVISRRVLDDYLAAIARSSGAKAADGLRRYYQSNDARALLGKAMRPYGLHSDDLGDITTAYLVVMWMTANDAAPPAADRVTAVSRQVRALLGASPPAVDASARQRAAESLIYQTVTLIRVREEAQKQRNRPYLAALADSAQASMARQGFDLRALAMTQDGLLPR